MIDRCNWQLDKFIMIDRIGIYLIWVMVLTDYYLDHHFLRHAQRNRRLKRWSLWLSTFFLSGFTLKEMAEPNFMPDDYTSLYLFLFLLGIFILPKTCFALCHFVGQWLKKRLAWRRNWGSGIGILGAVFIGYITLYGCFVGFRQLEVKHVDIYSKDLPPAFDGYRMVHISDLHVGTYRGSRMPLLEQIVDSVLAQKGDVILFTGDLQNVEPSEIVPTLPVLRRLQAPDGVFSVFGNHDYSLYIAPDSAIMSANERQLMALQRSMGWQLLMNEHRVIRRGTDSLVVVGTENDGAKPFPSRADMGKALQGVDEKAYKVLLQHDPSAWKAHILPHSAIPLTLSGHTHGGQINLWGLRPTLFSQPQDKGLYAENDAQLYVTAGLGGTIPLRFGTPREIVVLTLHRSR